MEDRRRERDPDAPEPVAGQRGFTAISGFDTFVNARPPTSKPPERQRNRLPDIPRAPALPQFRDNTAPPSYAPHRLETELEARRTKSLLPRNAGRYSEVPAAPEQLGKRTVARPSGTASKPPPSDRKVRETVPGTPDRIRSGMPPGSPSPLPTLFDIASWIDEGRHRDAIAAINRAGPEAGPRVLPSCARRRSPAPGYLGSGAGRARSGNLGQLPQLDPGSARRARDFLRRARRSDARAPAGARRALDQDPDRPLIRLTYALAAVRGSRAESRTRRCSTRRIARSRATPGARGSAARATPGAESLHPGQERAIPSGRFRSRSALGLDPRSPDALAAVAEASARPGAISRRAPGVGAPFRHFARRRRRRSPLR